jgi:hypothetical protein
MYKPYRNFGVAVCGFGLLLGSCVEPYELPQSAANQDYLVVDGALDIESGTGRVVLARTQNLADPGLPAFEKGAQVTVETEEDQPFRLPEAQDGRYVATGLALNYGKKYRLRVLTRSGGEYLSDFVSTQRTPEIDSITWHVERDGVLVKVNTHDPQNNTRHYRWEYKETYEYHADAYSIVMLVDGEIKDRQPEDIIYRCYKTDVSHRIFIKSTVQLSQDVVQDFPLVFHSGRFYQLGWKYSVLVRQFAISQEEFAYWQMLKKNTESVGTLFDAQPSQVTGNVRSIGNADEPVMGLFGAYSVQEKRKFITSGELIRYGFRPPYTFCRVDTLKGAIADLEGGYIFIAEGPLIYTSASCADCRLKGGITVRPDFWD